MAASLLSDAVAAVAALQQSRDAALLKTVDAATALLSLPRAAPAAPSPGGAVVWGGGEMGGAWAVVAAAEAAVRLAAEGGGLDAADECV